MWKHQFGLSTFNNLVSVIGQLIIWKEGSRLRRKLPSLSWYYILWNGWHFLFILVLYSMKWMAFSACQHANTLPFTFHTAYRIQGRGRVRVTIIFPPIIHVLLASTMHFTCFYLILSVVEPNAMCLTQLITVTPVETHRLRRFRISEY